MEAKVRTLQRCLDCINKVIRNANDILCDISQPSVCIEVLLSPQGTAYISGVAEVYRVAKRVESGMEARGISNEMLRQRLREIEMAWNNLQAFLSFSPSVLRMLDPKHVGDSLTYEGGHFHASCANFWLNRVESNLPALTASPQTPLDSKTTRAKGNHCEL